MTRKLFKNLVDEYLESRDFARLTASQDQYKYWLRTLAAIDLRGKPLSAWNYNSLTAPMCQEVYDTLSDRGVTFANRILAVARKVFNFGIKYGHLERNPFSKVQANTEQPRRVVWSRKDVIRFLDVAYSHFDTRSIGLITQMAYEWGQRIGDMRELQWDSLNLNECVLDLTQSKRRAVVHLPISEDLCEMLKQQHEDLGWQPYVAPNVNAKISGGFKPYDIYQVSRIANKVIEDAGLNTELRLSDLRRTAATEMVEAGVGLAQIMQVTGHQNPQSVKPYMKNTLTGATNALTLRSAHTAGET